eukprot:g17346.t1
MNTRARHKKAAQFPPSLPRKLMHIAATKKEEIHDLASYGFRQKSDGGEVQLTHNWQEMCSSIQGYIKNTLNQAPAARGAWECWILPPTKTRDEKTPRKRYARVYNWVLAGQLQYVDMKSRKAAFITETKLPKLKAGSVRMTVLSDTHLYHRSLWVPSGGSVTHGPLTPLTASASASSVRLHLFGHEHASGEGGEKEESPAGTRKDTTVMVRSMLLRGFDRECVDKIDAYMQKVGVKFLRGCAMNYRLIATTVFTPLEYGMCGLTEEQCKEKFGDDGYSPYTKAGRESEVKPLEWSVVPHRAADAFFKILVDNNTGKIVGFHVLGPQAGDAWRAEPPRRTCSGPGDAYVGGPWGETSFGLGAGEITQAMAVAMKMGVKKEQLDSVVGIHPTLAETMTMMSGTKIVGVKWPRRCSRTRPGTGLAANGAIERERSANPELHRGPLVAEAMPPVPPCVPRQSIDDLVSSESEDRPLPTVQESDPLTPPHKEKDPLMLSMGSSAGLIAWSKNLQPEELSPQASLASFFPAS